MNMLLKIFGALLAAAFLLVLVITLLTPWMDRWGATDDELSAVFPGDELVPEPASFVNRAVTIRAAPEEIYPWLLQIGAEKGGWYSHSWLERMIMCPITNADRIHPEWQDLQIGDEVKMCPEGSGPPPYEVAQLHPNQAVVLGHKEGGEWVDLWQFVLLPQTDGSTRLVVRTRTMMAGGFWTIIHPGVFVMESGMLQGIQERAETMAAPSISGAAATPTPEVFNPLDPSPTPGDSDLPLTCQVTDLNVFIERAAGFCFAYPLHFGLGEDPSDRPDVIGPALDDSPDPLQASLAIDLRPVPAGSDLTALVDAFLASLGELPWTVAREPLTVGGEPAEVLEPVPVLGSARVVLLLHGNSLFTLSFHPVDFEVAKPDLEALYQTVTGSFAFLPYPGEAASDRMVAWAEFGVEISLSYDPVLAPWVIARTAAAVPSSDQILYAEAHPANAEFVFYGFNGGRVYDLPLFPVDNRLAQVKIFRTEDFPGYGDDHPSGFVGQLQALQDLLPAGVDSSQCETPHGGDIGLLPYLPWINMAQTFCAQPQIVEFSGGRGVRYLSQFSQGLGPVLDTQVFYTFQGLTDDGRFYVAAFFPVATGVFPEEPPSSPECCDADTDPFEVWAEVLGEQLVRLNALSGDEFAPDLELLDDLIASIRIGQ
jgi:hypothetical protein